MKNRILVVDDDKSNCRLINRILAGHDYEMEFAYNGEDALDLLSDFEPDLIILDIAMPGIDGYEVCRRLKSDKKTSEIMVLLLSGKSALEERLKGYEVEADDYLIKPYDNEELRAKVRILVRLKNAQKDLQKELIERKRVTAALQQTNEILDSILSASPVGIGLVEDGNISWVNTWMVKILGFEDEHDYRNKSYKIIYPSEEEYEGLEDIMYSNLKAGKPARVDASFRRKDGSTFLGELMMSCPDPSNPKKRAIITISDISWRKQAEQDRLERERLQAVIEMAAAVCHEINQPMQVVSGHSDLLLKNIAEDHPLYERVKEINDQISKMGKITNKLMRITRYETREYVGGKKMIDIDRAVK